MSKHTGVTSRTMAAKRDLRTLLPPRNSPELLHSRALPRDAVGAAVRRCRCRPHPHQAATGEAAFLADNLLLEASGRGTDGWVN
jgi:hypothetical protein